MKKTDFEVLRKVPVSEHFTLDEVLTTDKPQLQSCFPSEYIANISRMINKMELVRTILQRPIVVTSWFRSPKLNAAVGGVETSAHLKGLAVDFFASREDFRKLQDGHIAFDQLIYYPNRFFIHIGLRFHENGDPNFRHMSIIKK